MVLMYTVNYVFAPGVNQRRFIDTLIFLPGHMFFTYTQMYIAVPQFLLKRKYQQYFLYTFLFLTTSVFYAHWAQANLIDWDRPMFSARRYTNYKYFLVNFGRSSFALFFTAGLAVAIKLFREWFRQREQTLKAENEKVRLELESLRSQIHPHFLFNTLNNLYSLTLTSSASASLVVVHLSDLLRYMLYECKEPQVPVEKELQMLKKYIELEKLRYGNRLDAAFTISGETKGLTVSPLLLLPFVENSFKHGVSDQIDQCWININVHVEKSVFTFQASNSRVEKQETTLGGLGMENVRKRLQILYPETHHLKIVEENEIYVVKLELILNKTTDEKKLNDFDVTEKTQVVHTI
jgi:sensor histidine kinase YesM